MCTPFDENSAATIAEMGFDLIKVASCSAKDWPLIEARGRDRCAGRISRPAGLRSADVDDLVVFSEHRAMNLALMHCVSIYPTPASGLQSAQHRHAAEALSEHLHRLVDP